MNNLTKLKLKIDIITKNNILYLKINIIDYDGYFQYDIKNPQSKSYYSIKEKFYIKNYSKYYDGYLDENIFFISKIGNELYSIFYKDINRKKYLIRLYKTLLEWGKAEYETDVKIEITNNIWELKIIKHDYSVLYTENYL